jgi:hypothetical protein
VQLRTVADDNVFFSKDDRESDVGFWVLPRMELGYRTSVWEVGADVGVDFRRYVQHSELNELFPRVSAFGEAGVLPGLTVRISDHYVPQPEILGLPEDDSSNLLQTNRTEAEIRYWRPFGERREFTIGVLGQRFITDSFGETEFDPANYTNSNLLPPSISSATFTPADAPPTNGNYWEAGTYFEFENALWRRSSVYLQGRFRYRDFDEFQSSDHTEYSALLGFRMYWLKNLELDVAGGYGLLDFRTGRNVPRMLGRADIRYAAGGGWHFRLGAHSRFSADVAGNDFVDYTGRLEIEKYFGTRTVISATGFVSYLENDSRTPKADLFGGVELRARRQLSRRVDLELSYRFWDNAGNFTENDFLQNRGMLTLRYRY